MENEATAEAPETEQFTFEIAKHNAVQLKTQAEEVAERLDAKELELKAAIDRVTNKWKEVNSELIAEAEAQHGVFADYEAKLRNAAVKHFEETGEKQIGFGISIRVDTKYEYEEDAAVEYAISHNMPHMLKIDGPKFKKLAAITPLDFVKSTPKPTAVISYSKD